MLLFSPPGGALLLHRSHYFTSSLSLLPVHIILTARSLQRFVTPILTIFQLVRIYNLVMSPFPPQLESILYLHTTLQAQRRAILGILIECPSIHAWLGSSLFMPPASHLFSCHIPCETHVRIHAFSASLIVFFSILKKAAACAPSLLPRITNVIFICSGLQLQKLPAGTPWCFFSPPFQLLNTMSFMPRGENRRSACSVNQTMWRTCGIFCAWSLLFLTDVCAQSQRRYTFIYFFPLFLFQFNLKAEWARCQCSLWRSSAGRPEFIQRNILQSWLPPARTCGALNWPRAGVHANMFIF